MSFAIKSLKICCALWSESENLNPFHCVTAGKVWIRDRSKFTGYLGRILGKICPKKVFAPFLFSSQTSYETHCMHLLYLSCANEHTWPNIFDLQKWLFWRMKSSKKSTGPLFYSKKKIFTPYFFFRKKFWPLSLKYSNIYTRGGAGPPPVCAPKSPRSDFSATSLLVLEKIWLKSLHPLFVEIKVFAPFLSKKYHCPLIY